MTVERIEIKRNGFSESLKIERFSDADLYEVILDIYCENDSLTLDREALKQLRDGIDKLLGTGPINDSAAPEVQVGTQQLTDAQLVSLYSNTVPHFFQSGHIDYDNLTDNDRQCMRTEIRIYRNARVRAAKYQQRR